MRALKQDAKEKRYGRICLLLGIILLGTVGCSHTVSDTPSIDAEIAEFLQVSESQAESLWEGIQTIDQNSRAEKTTVHVRQAFGNEREMYVLYDVTFSTEIDLQKEENNGILPTTVTLSGVGEVSKAGKGGSVYTIGINGQTITYLSYFDRNGTAVRPKGGSGGGAAEDPLGKEPLTNIAGSIDFRVPLELSDVAAVQIDGYTVPLSKS